MDSRSHEKQENIMIVVCIGDSFTEGAELWEEKNIPGYKNMNESDALTITDRLYLENKISVDDSKKLTYTQYLSMFFSKVINLGQSGSSEQEIVANAFTAIGQILKNKNDKIIIVLQNTNADRIWMWNKLIGKNSSVILSSNNKKFDKIDDVEIRTIALRYLNDSLLLSNKSNNILALQNYCYNIGVGFISFDVFPSAIKLNENCHIYPSMHEKLESYYRDTNFILPGGHFDCNSQLQIGKWLISEMKKRSII